MKRIKQFAERGAWASIASWSSIPKKKSGRVVQKKRALLVAIFAACSPHTTQDTPPSPSPVTKSPPMKESSQDRTRVHPSGRSVLKDCRTGVLITEFMVNPEAALDRFGEYVEITNVTNDTIDLSGWRLSNSSNQTFVFPPNHKIRGGASQILAGSLNPDLNGEIQVAEVWIGFTLPNEKGVLHLRTACNDSVDRIRYSNRKDWPRPKPGYSFERRLHQPKAMSTGQNWKRSTQLMVSGDFGSPGFVSPRVKESLKRSLEGKRLNRPQNARAGSTSEKVPR